MTVLDNINNLDMEIENAKKQIEEYTKSLKKMTECKKRQEQLLDDYLIRGFAISEKSEERILNWEAEHNMKCKNRYIDYIFTKTELGTALSVRCPKCKRELTGLQCSNDPLYADYADSK